MDDEVFPPAEKDARPLSMTTYDVLVLGGGVAATQAVNVARHLGATVIGLDPGGGDVRANERIAADIEGSDVVIAAVQPSDRPPPLLISAAAVEKMAAGSVIMDLAASRGGNCELTKCGKTVIKDGVKVIGPRNLAAEMPGPASRLYAENLECLLGLIVTVDGRLKVDLSDEILAAACITEEADPS